MPVWPVCHWNEIAPKANEFGKIAQNNGYTPFKSFLIPDNRFDPNRKLVSYVTSYV